MNEELSRLEAVDLREVWTDEAQDFTPWLAKEENLRILGETVNMELELEAQEVDVGDFRADILCKTDNDSWVLIENQLEETNHKHLGQILTYAAGLDAHTVIWIAKDFRDEHRAALDQLNEITNERYRYFGVEIKVWKIGNSVPAPQFDIVCKPNNVPTPTSSINDWKTRYWHKLNDCFQDRKQNFNIYIPGSKNSVIFGIGKPNTFALRASLSPQKKRIGINLLLQDDDAIFYFQQLQANREEIQKEVGEKLEWDEAPNFKVKKVSIFKSDISPENEESWSDQHTWFAEKLELFDNVFRQRLQELDPSDYLPEDTDVE